jgi:hypothetical protein
LFNILRGGIVAHMDLISPVATAIAYFMVINAIGVSLMFVAQYLARASTNFFKGG